MRAWNIGNTTVRNPYRLKDGLRVLRDSPVHGNLEGREAEDRFARLLRDAGVLTLPRLDKNPDADVSDMGRKWRAALSQLGFIRDKREAKDAIPATESGKLDNSAPYSITPNGNRLLSASTVAAEQEVFLRSIAAIQIPSILEPRGTGQVFKPLMATLQLLQILESRHLEAILTFEEVSWFVQVTWGGDDLGEVADRISAFRSARAMADNKREFDRSFMERHIKPHLQGQELGTLVDYADTNIRYLKATGLLSAHGRGIALTPYRAETIRQLIDESVIIADDQAYLEVLGIGLHLPTDDEVQALRVVRLLEDEIRKYGETPLESIASGLDIRDITQTRLHLEEQLMRARERVYAAEQKAAWQDIAKVLHSLATARREGIPRGEAPAYLEWALWRAFLAINSLENRPWQARRFQVDQDFMPVGTAPGRGPDMIFEFPTYVLVVEVTLTSSSRQEAAEGEPVRRHVADVVLRHAAGDQSRPIYGLFVANDVDSNTAETLRIGTWYDKDDVRMPLRIVPLTLPQFTALFEHGFERGGLTHAEVERILLHCLADRNADGPQWKRLIDVFIRSVTAH